MELHRAQTLSGAWLAAAHSLLARSTTKAGRETWDLAVEIAQPLAESPAIREALDVELARQGLQTIDTVANTIFPSALQRMSIDRLEFFTRYRRMVPKLRRFPKNHHGLYFDRLTAWPPGASDATNQVEAVIGRLISERSHEGSLRFVYDMSLFSPLHDSRPIGFPCLAYLNVKLDGDLLRLTAHYRNHYFVERAYGNYLGLARLQQFIASQAGLTVGPLVCISGHAELEPKHADAQFVRTLRKLVNQENIGEPQ